MNFQIIIVNLLNICYNGLNKIEVYNGNIIRENKKNYIDP